MKILLLCSLFVTSLAFAQQSADTSTAVGSEQNSASSATEESKAIQSKAEERSVNKIQLSHERPFTRANFTLGTSVAQLKGRNGSAMALGPKGGFEYGLTEKLALGANMSFTFQASGQAAGAFFYSGLSALFKYAVVGSSVKIGDSIYQKDGTLVYSSKPIAKRRIALAAGIEQLFLNGATSIYPAIGPTAGVAMAFGFQQFSLEFDFMTSSLLANDNPLGMIQVGANINLDM